MHAGQLDRVITIQRQVHAESPDGYGVQPGAWVDVFTRVPAQVQDALPSKSESGEGGLRQADRPARVRMRFTRGISPDMRIVVHNDVDDIYQIDSEPAEIGRREWLEFTARAFRT